MTTFDSTTRALMGEAAYRTGQQVIGDLPEPHSAKTAKLLEHCTSHGEFEIALRIGALAECIQDLRHRLARLETSQ